MALLRPRSEPPAGASPKTRRVHPVDLAVLLYLFVGFPLSVAFLPSAVSLFLFVLVVIGWVAWKMP